MSTKYKFKEQDRLYFVSFAVVGWIDLFIRNEYRQIILDSWKYCQQNKGLDIYGWCIMHQPYISRPFSGLKTSTGLISGTSQILPKL